MRKHLLGPSARFRTQRPLIRTGFTPNANRSLMISLPQKIGSDSSVKDTGTSALGADQALGCVRSRKISVSAHSGYDPLRYLKELTIRKMIHQRSNLDRHLFTLADHRHAKQSPSPIPIRPSKSYGLLTPASRAGYNSNPNQR